MRKNSIRNVALGLLVAMGCFSASAHAQSALRAVGNYSGNKVQVDEVERPFFDALGPKLGMNVSFNPMDAIGVGAADALRLIRSGAFDIMSVQIGMVARDDPFFEGIDLAGVVDNIDQQREAANAIRDKFDERLQSRFNAKLLTLWPFGPQVMWCNGDVKGLEDLNGKKIRVFTSSMSRVVEGLGATPVTIQPSEVYLALQRGVVDCGVTAPSAGNNGKWPEVTNVFMPLTLAYSVQGHFMNLDSWNRLSPEQQETLTTASREMEDQLWDIAKRYNEDAAACNTGKEGCSLHTSYDLTEVQVDESARALISDIVKKSVLPVWADNCKRGYPECPSIWNDTVGAVTGHSIQ
ncbi:MAG TPA: TRAP transporter substrate-binding protein [Paenalcaligenes sp.]|nr:TRAP transporter substrate-binding protein [Paenalcaligenes sp.]